MDLNYLKVASHRDLSGKDRYLYRFFEIIPGSLTWLTILGIVYFSWKTPVAAAVFIIVFDIYWIIKTLYLSIHLRVNYQRMQEHLAIDWESRLQNFKWDKIWQFVLMPMYKENYEVVSQSFEALCRTRYPKERMIVVLAWEERGGEAAKETALKIEENYKNKFGHFLSVSHPKNLPGEIAGKGANCAYAAQKAKIEIIDKLGIPYENIIVSNFDIDTQPYPQYFLCLTHYFLASPEPHRSSYQPVPIYNNNIWQAPAISRVMATGGTFCQMMQQERPERLVTFSSQSMSFKALIDVGFWQKNMISEDSRIFFNCFLRYDGDYRVVPLSYPVSMDANFGKNFMETFSRIYKQQRRWSWGVENIPYLFYGFLKNREISFERKFYYLFNQIEGFWAWSTNALIIFALGWLPTALGGGEFNATLLSYNLPIITRYLMTIAMFGLLFSAIISTKLLPPRPADQPKTKYIWMVLQWFLVPFTLILLGAIPAIESQTRLMLNKPLAFWVTPKIRK